MTGNYHDLSVFRSHADTYHASPKPVTGGNKRIDRDMDDMLNKFLETGVFGLLLRNEMGEVVLNATTDDITGIRGTKRNARIDIQGADGTDNARIAYQIGKSVIAQVVVPLKSRIEEAVLIRAFHDSLKMRKVIIIDPSPQ